MGEAVEQLVEETTLLQKKWFRDWKFIIAGIVIIIVLIIGALSFYQATHFNENKKINDVDVSGLTAKGALKMLQTSILTNEVFIGDQLIFDGLDTQMAFTESDLPEIKKILKSQWSFFPTFETINFLLKPSEQDQYRTNFLKNELEQTLISINLDLIAPIDAYVFLEKGEIIVSKSVEGKQYDINSLLEEYDMQEYTSEIHLTPVYLQPIKEDSEVVKQQEETLKEFLLHTVDYTVQDQVHSLLASELVKNASLTETMEVLIDDPSDIKNKLAEINDAQSTLGKDFTFKTHSGSVISVKGKGYGWALDVEKETALIQEAFEQGEKSISASHIYGNGWSNEGFGYETTVNYGIGDTYAEVSIKDQRIWIYKDGNLVVTTNVVTGRKSTKEDTLPGVWYILYKRTPYTLTGTSVDDNEYAIEVDYWAPFTNSGQGFHDASWRENWASNAYLTAGSGGCVNVPPSMMKKVYENLKIYQPVVVY
ncbi:L,D-transpeptidase family protein [Anaerobacillus sp. CMMVII]|uniref:L,D-transpeptidase family protein n=1 Tax=Anaerobacillus sp. CMMVII TaxID=2755588 RepID=UPI0021B7A7AE|nr:L,D-transpeptidase family protein [Anaerobacillus sp. CMMVII]MCT8137625.1 L,D-transpeptidase family protein [Anaerobacillus sp. CMMVII]